MLVLSSHSLRNSGGMERYALTLVRGLHERGLRPVVVAKSFDESLPEYGWVDPIRLGVAGVPGKLRDRLFDWRLRRLQRRLDLHPLVACTSSAAADIAIVGGTHPGYLDAMPRQRKRLSDRWKIDLERAHLTRSRFVVVHSRLLADETLRFYGIDLAKVQLLYPPVDAERFTPPADDEERRRLRRQLGLPADRAVFLLASTGHRRKGLDLLARVFDTTTLPVCLALAGRAPDVAARNLHYLGYRSDIENVYRAVDFTVMASIYEPFGLVGVESVLCGTPVLLAANVGCAEVIRAPAALTFSLAEPGGFERAVEAAVQRWRDGSARLAAPREGLGYDPSVAPHLDALLALAAQVSGNASGAARR